MADQNSFQSYTRPLSSSVAGTFVLTQERQLELLVLWRDEPGWFAAPQSQGVSAQGGTIRISLKYGPTALDLLYDRVGRSVRTGDLQVSFAADQNVVTVDDADGSSGAPVVKVLTADLHVDTTAATNPTFSSVFKRSPEIIAFLRCDVEVDNPITQRALSQFVCDDL